MTLSAQIRYWHFQLLQFIRIRAFKALARNFVINQPERNGELWLVEKLYRERANSARFTVIDVGGNRGLWGRAVASVGADVQVHSCEPVPEFFAQLEAEKHERQSIHNVALGRVAGNQTIFVTGNDAGGSAARQRPGKNNYDIKIETITGDALVHKAGIDRVDFIKVDVDGREYDVLEGFSDTITGHRPVIQFEFGDFSYYCNHPFHQFWELAERHRYAVYRLHQSRLHLIKRYRPYHELAINFNYVLAPRD